LAGAVAGLQEHLFPGCLSLCCCIEFTEGEIRRGKEKEHSMRLLSRAVKSISLAGALVLAGVVLGVPAANAGTATTPDSATIGNQVHHNLVSLHWYNLFDNLVYQVNGGEVILSGQVIADHAQTKYDAENAVRRIPGLTRVVNNIEILPTSPFDDQIRRAEYRAIFSKSDLGRYTLGAVPQFHIIVKNGHVTLDGVVMNQMDKTMAGIAANTVPNVFSVTNNLQIG
jgi:hyperosmotically inducible periplasmic protein